MYSLTPVRQSQSVLDQRVRKTSLGVRFVGDDLVVRRGPHAPRKHECEDCLGVCNQGAISFDEGKTHIDRGRCNMGGACVQICPVDPIIEDYEVTLKSQGETTTKTLQRVANVEELPIWVERWRVRHAPVQSGSWVAALAKLADEKANMIEIESKRAIKRRDLIVALEGDKELREREAERREKLLKALVDGKSHV